MMRNILYTLVVTFGLSLVTGAAISAHADGLSERSQRKIARTTNASAKSRKFSNVCKSVKPISKALLKNNAGGHIPRSDRRYDGFAFVCGKECPSSFPVKAYYSDGTLAFSLGYYGRWSGNGKPRAYCAAGGAPYCKVSSVKTASRQKGRDGKVYLAWGKGACRSATPGIRNGTPL